GKIEPLTATAEAGAEAIEQPCTGCSITQTLLKDFLPRFQAWCADMKGLQIRFAKRGTGNWRFRAVELQNVGGHFMNHFMDIVWFRIHEQRYNADKGRHSRSHCLCLLDADRTPTLPEEDHAYGIGTRGHRVSDIFFSSKTT